MPPRAQTVPTLHRVTLSGELTCAHTDTPAHLLEQRLLLPWASSARQSQPGTSAVQAGPGLRPK